MNGLRNLHELARETAKFGLGASPEAVRSFARELVGYGFLVKDGLGGGVESSVSSSPSEADNAEIQHLLSMANVLSARGQLNDANNYLLAVLEIDPTNHIVRDQVRQLQNEIAEKAQNITAESKYTDSVSPKRPDSQNAHAEPKIMRWLSWAVGLVVVVGLLGGGLALFLVKFYLKPAQVNQAKPQSAVTANVPPPQPKAGEFHVALEALKLPPVLTEKNGIVAEIFVKEKQVVSRGEALLKLCATRDYQRWVSAQRAYEQLKNKSSRDTVYRYYLSQAEQKLKKTERATKFTTIKAGQAGQITGILAKEGLEVKTGDVLLELAQTNTLVGLIPRQLLPSVVPQNCKVQSSDGHKVYAGKFGESVRDHVGLELLQILVEGGEGKNDLRPGKWVKVIFEVSPASSGTSPHQ